MQIRGTETKIFDPKDGFAPFTDLVVATDSSVVKRGNRWWMYLAGPVVGHPAIQLFSASLPEGAPLAASGWKLTPRADDPTKIELLSGQTASAPWDMKGGRHCPSYVRGWDPDRGDWVERIYYAGGAENVWGPYTIGYLEWDGHRWIDQPAPVFEANEDWEHSSVYEPNLIYVDGKWKMWYVSGSNQEDYIVHGFAESPNGRDNWSKHQIVFPAEEKVFDFCVIPSERGYEAVFSRVWLAQAPASPKTGLWWCHSKTPSPNMSDWSAPIHIMTAEDRGWHSGPWKPSVHYSETDPNRILVFFDGIYKKDEPGPFPFVFTLGCLEIDAISS
ncbi:MAG TPA: hypothetical protein VKT81_00140 [Bryobacteraceae bacterium]|nr:hypothetical protein [Bryobacteraceae bacterium]